MVLLESAYCAVFYLLFVWRAKCQCLRLIPIVSALDFGL